MSFAIDANVLLYASDSSSQHHGAARSFLESHFAQTEIIYIAYATLASYLRISTHPGLFKAPLSPEQALENVRNLSALPNVRLIAEQEGFLDVYQEVTKDVPARGNLVPDAHLATLLKQHGIKVIYTNDTDFRKFAFLTVKSPFS